MTQSPAAYAAVQAIRSLGLLGQTGAGKTSLAEALLHEAGALGAPGAGVGELLDVMEALLPKRAEGNPPQFDKGEGSDATALHADPDPAQHVIAHVFKITVDPCVGKMGVFRIHQGTVTRDSQFWIGDGPKPFKDGKGAHPGVNAACRSAPGRGG